MEEENNMYELLFILKNIDQFKWSDALFLPEKGVWNKDTKGMVLDPDDIEDDEADVPEEAQKKKLRYVLGISEIEDIINNAKSQKYNITDDELIEAFRYYFDNDAYIDIKE